MRKVHQDQRARHRRANAVAAHAHLSALCEAQAVRRVISDDVGVGKALGSVELARRQHAQADVDDLVILPLDRDEAESLAVGDGPQRLISGISFRLTAVVGQ